MHHMKINIFFLFKKSLGKLKNTKFSMMVFMIKNFEFSSIGIPKFDEELE